MDISEEKGFVCSFCNYIFIVPKKESESTVICPKCRKIVSQQAPSRPSETTTAQRSSTQQIQAGSIQRRQDKEADVTPKNHPPFASSQTPQKVDLTNDFQRSSFVGKTCPYCQAPIKPGVAVKVCLACNIPHHTECWKENGGCTTYGCQQANAEGQAPAQRGESETLFCSSCGTRVSAQERFCSGCGLAVGQTRTPAGSGSYQEKKINWYLEVLKKYAVFSGRARRKEYWMFFLFNWIIMIVLIVIETAAGITLEGGRGVISTIYQLVVLIPSIAVGVRRMHDTDHSGWWLLFPIVNFFLATEEGARGNNRFGSDPKTTLYL